MRRVSAIILSLLAVSCAGMDKHARDTFYPLNNPNMPDVHSEVAQRVRGKAMSTTPILPEEGDVWPGQPEPVPSLQDVSRSNDKFYDRWRQARPRLDRDLDQQLADGQGMSMGEGVGRRYGGGKNVMPVNAMPVGKPLPSHVQDNAPSYMEAVKRGVVTIPNGDGTVTLIAPDGTVKIAREGQASALQTAKTFHQEQQPVEPPRHEPDDEAMRVASAGQPAPSRKVQPSHETHDVAEAPHEPHRDAARVASVSQTVPPQGVEPPYEPRKPVELRHEPAPVADTVPDAGEQEESTPRRAVHRKGRKVRHTAAAARAERRSRLEHRVAAHKVERAKAKAKHGKHRHQSSGVFSSHGDPVWDES